VTDCYSGYFASAAGAKQKCLAHLARKARDWQKLTEGDSADYVFFEDIKQFVKRCCNFCRRRGEGKLSKRKQAAEKAWLRAELSRLETCEVSHEKAITLQARLLRHPGEWLVFLNDLRVPPTNNLAERALRPLVVLRKITFGSRSDDGATRMAKIMTIGETARRHGHRASDIAIHTSSRSRVATVVRWCLTEGRHAAPDPCSDSLAAFATGRFLCRTIGTSLTYQRLKRKPFRAGLMLRITRPRRTRSPRFIVSLTSSNTSAKQIRFNSKPALGLRERQNELNCYPFSFLTPFSF